MPVPQNVPGVRPVGLNRDRPDNTTSVVGGEGLQVRQDVDGTQIQRLGIPGADADWGPARLDITDGEAIIANPDRVGGTSAASGIVRSLADENVGVVFAWTDDVTAVETIQEARDDIATVVEELANGAGDTEFIIENITTKSDNCIVFVEDKSAGGVENTIEYTLNIH